MSNKAIGKDPRGPELDNPEVFEGISVFDSLDSAKSKTATVPGVTHFAKVLPEGVGVIRKTLGKGHYTWWVDPKADLGTIRRIYPCCRSCGQVFLYVRSEETESTRLWRYYPIDAETAAKLVAEELDADEYTDRMKPEAHMRVVETFFRAAPCKVEWVGRLTTD